MFSWQVLAYTDTVGIMGILDRAPVLGSGFNDLRVDHCRWSYGAIPDVAPQRDHVMCRHGSGVSSIIRQKTEKEVDSDALM